jgi:fumarate reductase flavoprotein subunit
MSPRPAITTGGAGRLYRVTTNAVICEGIGHAIALETGAVALGNMEASSSTRRASSRRASS